MPRAPRIAWLVIASLAQPLLMPPAVAEEPLVKPLPEVEAQAETDWADLKAEFDRICGQVQVAPSLSEAELRMLIEDCRALREALLQSENPQAKVFLKRIQMCEDFFEYSLEAQPQEVP